MTRLTRSWLDRRLPWAGVGMRLQRRGLVALALALLVAAQSVVWSVHAASHQATDPAHVATLSAAEDEPSHDPSSAPHCPAPCAACQALTLFDAALPLSIAAAPPQAVPLIASCARAIVHPHRPAPNARSRAPPLQTA